MEELIQIGAALGVIVITFGGLRLIRSTIEKRIGETEDPMTWDEFEREHGEAEFKGPENVDKHPEEFPDNTGESCPDCGTFQPDGNPYAKLCCKDSEGQK